MVLSLAALRVGYKNWLIALVKIVLAATKNVAKPAENGSVAAVVVHCDASGGLFAPLHRGRSDAGKRQGLTPFRTFKDAFVAAETVNAPRFETD
jgi:hypothetical protein